MISPSDDLERRQALLNLASQTSIQGNRHILAGKAVCDLPTFTQALRMPVSVNRNGDKFPTPESGLFNSKLQALEQKLKEIGIKITNYETMTVERI